MRGSEACPKLLIARVSCCAFHHCAKIVGLFCNRVIAHVTCDDMGILTRALGCELSRGERHNFTNVCNCRKLHNATRIE